MQDSLFKNSVRSSSGFTRLIAVTLLLASCDSVSPSDENIAPGSSAPLVYVKRSVQALAEPVDPVSFVAGGDLYWRDSVSATAREINLTRSYTGGSGDVSSPEVSYDGSKIIFSMRGPADTSWNLWTVDVATKNLSRVISNDAEANLGNDLNPHFLADGRIIFSSTRQKKTREQLVADNTEAFSTMDAKGRHASSLLHVMNADGSNIHQVSFHVGHDRDVTLLNNGRVIFNRWEASGNRNHFPIIQLNPDGTKLETLYGAYSKGNSFLSPRQLENGHLVAIHAPAAGTHGGGALVEIDINNFGDLYDRVDFINPGAVAQKQITLNTINIEKGVSPYGRFLSPYPVLDGTNRILVSWSASKATEVTDIQSGQPRDVEAVPGYGVYLMDLDTRQMKPIVKVEQGLAAYDAVLVQARTAPTVISDQFAGIGGTLVQNLFDNDQGLIHVRSVYDTDINDLLGSSMMVPGETLPTIAAQASDPRSVVADINTLKDPRYTSADQRPARFVRISKAVPAPAGTPETVKGLGGNVMRQILGYSEVEPDGSVLVKVPADTPVTMDVLDASGRAITRQHSWMQVRPGEVLECAGCHSPRRRAGLNRIPIAGNNPIVQIRPPIINETMAETRARILNGDVNNPNNLNIDILYSDIWITNEVTASAEAGQLITAGTDITIDYSQLTTPAPVNGVINYVDHIQPLLDLRCVSCHNGGQVPDLRNITDADGVLLSYKNLVQGTVELDLAGNPQLDFEDQGWLVRRLLPYVQVGGPRSNSRSSYVMEKISGAELRANRAISGGTAHNVLNSSELRLFTEWLDSGAMYYNTPFGPDNNPANGQKDLAEIINLQAAPDPSEFNAQVYPVLKNRCASCHQVVSNKGDFKKQLISSTLINPVPSENRAPRFILTGDKVADYRAAVAQLEDRSNPAQNNLLRFPLSTGTLPVHPVVSDGQGGTRAVLINTEADYVAIQNWVMP